MNYFLPLVFTLFFNSTMFAQFSCTDLFYNEDSLIMVNDELYTGYCDFLDKEGKLESRMYYSYGELDSIAFYHDGLMRYMEPYVKEKIHGITKRFDKKGVLRKTTTYRNGKEEGLYREYDKRGKPRYEGDYLSDGELKNDTYYTWTKKGVKYKHSCQYIEKSLHYGELISYSSRRKCRKTKVTG